MNTMRRSLFHGMPRTRRVKVAAERFRFGLVVAAFAVSGLCLTGMMAEREEAQDAADRAARASASEAEARKLLQNCLNGYPLMTRSDAGQIDGAIFCSASKEVKL